MKRGVHLASPRLVNHKEILMNSFIRLVAVLLVALLAVAGCAVEGQEKKGNTNPPATPPPVVEPPVSSTGALTFGVTWPDNPARLLTMSPSSRKNSKSRVTEESALWFRTEVAHAWNARHPKRQVSIPDDSLEPLEVDLNTRWFRTQVELTEPMFADLVWPETEAVFGVVPTGPTTVDVTAWDGDETFEPTLLSYGSVGVTVLPCADPCGNPTQVTITLAPSNAVVTSPSGFVYGSGTLQDVSAQISFTNYPAGLRKAAFSVYVTDYPADPFTVFDPLCEGNQILTDTSLRECTGTLASSSALMALASGTVRLFVIIDGIESCRDFEDGNGCTLLPQDAGAGIPFLSLFSEPLSDAP
ncbi:MAG: hypothetical protein A3D67_03685 [Candidatus Lloydbacteria bacterium RIFCSPHIGHO2_02_FULL_51_22]|uniref:Uncharacterized protein n=2 Tax=Candidatus Lloydiibacteriota TaxID=1817910 RepID=A0A1G2DA15_9BACT|nr:MAG: hypothetical protein A3D67_03685 [Candidatus Lloydbacteria bacterium RIFCSPHIGHO2_02_FULL_51_22]OGZ16915.1 MAG: hypothetical protein A3G11_00345 [Candidatus Lloydbacteria bacterium RIFCSPLOWO2_12_FULL_51_9]